MPTRLNKELFIEKARAIHGNKYDYSKVEYINNKKPVQELDMKKLNLCKKHGVKLFYFSDAGISYPYDVYENKNEIIKLIKNGK